MRTALSCLVLAFALIGTATIAPAQTLNASELASISQVVDGTKVTVEYSRPRARGRRGLFGTEVKFGHVWTPGANQSTTLAVSKDVSINGHPVAKGKYSVWLVVAPGDWELVLDHDTTLYHTAGPKNRPGQVRFMVPREHCAFTEVLTWSFPAVQTSGMTLMMQWDTVDVPLDIKVTRSFATAVPAATGQRVVGTYHWHWAPIFANATAVKDTTVANYPGMKSPDATFTIRYTGGELHATIDPSAWGDQSYAEWVLIPKKADLFIFGRIDRGELIEVSDDWAMQFTPASGHAKSFEVRSTDDEVVATATIVP